MNVPRRRSSAMIRLLTPATHISRRRPRPISRARRIRTTRQCRAQRSRSRRQRRRIAYRTRTAQPSTPAKAAATRCKPIVTRARGTYPATTAFRSDGASEFVGVQLVCYTAECAQALQDLRGILAFVEIDGEETVVRGHVQWRGFAGAQEVRYILHLHEGHVRALEPDRCAWEAQIRESIRQ